MVEQAALATAGLPTAFGHVRLVAQAFGPGPDLRALAFPDGVMAMAGANKRVGDLVQQGIPDDLVVIAFHEMHGQLDLLLVKQTPAHRALATVESELPIAKAVARKEMKSESANVDQALRAP